MTPGSALFAGKSPGLLHYQVCHHNVIVKGKIRSEREKPERLGRHQVYSLTHHHMPTNLGSKRTPTCSQGQGSTLSQYFTRLHLLKARLL